MASHDDASGLCACQVEGCHRKRRSMSGLYCEAHYYRLRRTGQIELRPKPAPKAALQHSGGYLRLHAPDHPLAQRRGDRYEYHHRVVFYDAHGEGPFRCHVCAAPVGWGAMHVDHLNDDPADNRIENLAAACPTCNQWRGRQKMVATMRDRRGVWLEHQGHKATLGDWANRLGISRSALRFRLEAGWSLSDALSKGRGRSGPPSRTAAQANRAEG